MPVDSVNALNALADKGAYSFQLNFLEMLMAQPELTGQINNGRTKKPSFICSFNISMPKKRIRKYTAASTVR